MTLGLREGIIALIVLVAVYMAIVLWRMRRLNRPVAELVPPVIAPAMPEAALPASEPLAAISSEDAPAVMAEHVLRLGLEQEVAQLRDEVDAIRGELAALRQDMLQELAHLRAT